MPLRILTTLLLLFLVVAHGQEDRVLNLLCWSEYVPQSVIKGFTQETGARVAVANYNSNDQMLAMLRARPKYYDLIQPSQFYVETMAREGSLSPLNFARIPNARHLDPQYCGLPHDPAGRFSVPWLAGTVGIVVNTARIKEPISTWADVFSGKYAGRIVVVDDAREMVAWALATLGLPITDVSEASLERVRPLLTQWLPQVKVFDSDSPKTAFLEDRAEIGIVWSGEAALLWQQDRKYRYILPKEGAHMFLDSLAVPVGAPHQALAEDFINYCLRPEVSVQISNAYPYTNPNLAARRLLTPAQLSNPASYPPDNERLLPLQNIGNTSQAVLEFVSRLRARLANP